MSVLGSIIDFGTSIYNTERNIGLTRETNEKNEALTREAWSRDDNAIQRRVADLKAAGLSPTLAAGSAAAVSSPIKASPANSSIASNFGSQSLASDVAEVQQIKANRLANEGQEIANEQARHDLELTKGFGLRSGDKNPIGMASAIVALLTGEPVTEVAKRVRGLVSSFTGTAFGSTGTTGNSSGSTLSSSSSPLRVSRSYDPSKRYSMSQKQLNSLVDFAFDNGYIKWSKDIEGSPVLVTTNKRGDRYLNQIVKSMGMTMEEFLDVVYQKRVSR